MGIALPALRCEMGSRLSSCTAPACGLCGAHVFTVNQLKESMNSNVILMEQRVIVEIRSIAGGFLT